MSRWFFLRMSAAWVLAVLALSACGPTRAANFVDASDGARDGAVDGVTADTVGACTFDLQCDDRIACTVDHCRTGVCSHDPCADCCSTGLQCIVGYGCGLAPMSCAMDSECSDSIRCTLDTCRDGRTCAHLPQDGLCASGEICLAALGCVPRPPDHCARDTDCTMTPCLGTWYCDIELGCQFRSRTSCDDGDTCTADTCDDAHGGCHHAPRDGDMDGHGAMSCGGDDCDDMNASRHPGATEVCANGVDEDCNGMVDEGCCVAGLACTTTCGTGGTTTCAGPMTLGPCAPPAETCNGRDDNCDGVVDEGCCSTGAPCTTSCGSTGMTNCPGSTCIPPAETCNGRDDNCDGRVDETCCTAGAPCTTPCGSMGTTTCSTSGTPGPCMPPSESCNGRDDDCDGVADNSFACVRSGTTACTTTCGSAGTRLCGSDCSLGACMAPVETCNGRDDDCDGVVDNGYACGAGQTGPCATACGSTGTRSCLASCAWDTCIPPAETCNGVDDNCNATCDEGFTCCAGSTRDCTALGFYSGTAVCRGDCGGYDTSTCTNCGNGTKNPGEPCDGADLGGATCASIGMGFGSGTLRCAAGCMLDTTQCSRCGNGQIDAGEQCDGSNLNGATCVTRGLSGGTLRCSSSCAYDTSMCTVFNPTGTYTVSPAPSYTCVFGLVTFGASTMSLSVSGSTMTLTFTGLPCSPSGIFNATTRAFDLTCTAPGTCAETYRLVGMFTSDNAWTASFTAAYVGGPGACYDCTNRMWSVTGTR